MNLLHQLRIKNYKKQNQKYLNNLKLTNLHFDHFGYVDYKDSVVPAFTKIGEQFENGTYYIYEYCYSLEALRLLINNLSNPTIIFFANNLDYFKILYDDFVSFVAYIIYTHKLDISDIYSDEFIQKVYKEITNIILTKSKKIKVTTNKKEI